MTSVRLRPAVEADIPVHFAQQRNREVAQMIGFGPEDPDDWQGFESKWRRILANPDIWIRTVLWENEVAGHVVSFVSASEFREVGYLIAREHWGKGIASAAMRAFLMEFPQRPLHGCTASDNAGSIALLTKCGFTHVSSRMVYARFRRCEIEQLVFRLEGMIL